MGMLSWLRGTDAWRSGRRRVEDCRAFYWNGAQAEPHPVMEVGPNGAVIRTTETWYDGTVMQIVLQRAQNGHPPGHPDSSFSLWCRVVSQASEGVCVEFAFQNLAERRRFRRFLASLGGRKS